MGKESRTGQVNIWKSGEPLHRVRTHGEEVSGPAPATGTRYPVTRIQDPVSMYLCILFSVSCIQTEDLVSMTFKYQKRVFSKEKLFSSLYPVSSIQYLKDEPSSGRRDGTNSVSSCPATAAAARGVLPRRVFSGPS